VLDTYGRPTSITNAKNETTALERDPDHNVVELTEANGAFATWSYDPKTGPSTLSAIRATCYDPLDRTTAKTEKEGTANAKTTTYSYLGLSAEVLDEEVAGQLTRSSQFSPWGSACRR
jgi:YD repeat-containing protein